MPGHTGTGVQEESVVVDVAQAGVLDVTMTGTTSGGVDATPVNGTASPGGRISGRSVHWHVASAARGRHTFRAQFRVTADRTKVGTYAPRLVVGRTMRTTTLLDHAWARQPAGRSVRRVSVVTFPARVAPRYGTPRGRAHPWATVRDHTGLADSFMGMASLDAYGTYAATASGTAGVSTRLDLTRLHPRVPGGVGASMSVSWLQRGPEEKFVPVTDFLHDDGRLTGFGLSLCTLPAPGDSFAPGAGGVLYDGDAGTVAATAQIFDGSMSDDRAPRNSRGRIRPDWKGEVASGWSTWSLRSALDREAPPVERWFTYGANVGWIVTGGDVDNREGDKPVRGTPAVLRVPRGEVVTAAMASISWSGEQEFDIDLDAAPTSVSLRAGLAPGSYWLRSTRRGYSRDWALASSLTVSTRPAGSADAAASFASLQLVPPGTRTLVQYATTSGEVRRTVLEPGTWLVTTTGGALHVAAAESSAPADDCPRSL